MSSETENIEDDAEGHRVGSRASGADFRAASGADFRAAHDEDDAEGHRVGSRASGADFRAASGADFRAAHDADDDAEGHVFVDTKDAVEGGSTSSSA